MNGTTLKALRLSLGFSQAEACELIGQVKLRTWQYWEDENRKIPKDVIHVVRSLVKFKSLLISEASDQIDAVVKQLGEPEALHLTYYSNIEAWMTQVDAIGIEWRPHCMSMGALAEKYKFVKLIKFDPIAYQLWLGKKLDSPSSRSEWAGLQES